MYCKRFLQELFGSPQLAQYHMQGVMSTCELMCSDELEKLLEEGKKHCVGDKLRDD